MWLSQCGPCISQAQAETCLTLIVQLPSLGETMDGGPHGGAVMVAPYRPGWVVPSIPDEQMHTSLIIKVPKFQAIPKFA